MLECRIIGWQVLIPELVVEKYLHEATKTGTEVLRYAEGSMNARRLAVDAIEAMMDVKRGD